MINLHWAYFWEYFQATPIRKSESNKTTFDLPDLKRKNDALLATPFRQDLGRTLVVGNQAIGLRTTYPGLVAGTGLTHETHSTNELKLGLSFDFTTGLPIIPGSSVKGLLRSAFSLKSGDTELVNYLLQYELNPAALRITAPLPLATLAEEIFGPDTGSERAGSRAMKHYDVFFDAIIDPGHSGTFLATDYITPHINRKNPAMSRFTNPVPIPFLKIKSNVPIRFQFDLWERPGQLLSVAQRKALFEAILRFLGAGAKTRVGYGQFH